MLYNTNPLGSNWVPNPDVMHVLQFIILLIDEVWVARSRYGFSPILYFVTADFMTHCKLENPHVFINEGGR